MTLGSISSQAMKQKLSQALSRRQKQRIVDPSRSPAAVLIPIYHKEGQYYILFIKRTETVKYHKGQISFPGGAYEKDDQTLLNTALRETAEEVGLMVDKVEVLGELDDFVTFTSNYIVSPFAAFASPPYHFQADHKEVERIVEVPIPALLEEGSLHEESEVIDGKPIAAFFYHYQDVVIWGVTAQILNQFLEILEWSLELNKGYSAPPKLKS